MARLWQAMAGRIWPGRHEFSWIDQQGEQLTIYTLIPEYGKLITWRLPGEALVETVFGYGQYQWRKIFALGELDGRGGETLRLTSQQVLGLAVAGWRNGDRTNFSWVDWLKWSYWDKFKVKERLTIDLSQSDDWQRQGLINEQVFSQQAAGESLSLSLINGRRLGAVIANHGIELVSVTAGEAVPETTTLFIREKNHRHSLTVAWLKQLLPGLRLETATAADFWADLVLVVGKDYNYYH
jgi:hypothetical protein